MSIPTDQDILTEIQGLLGETENAGASWSSGMWTAAEVLKYLDDAQQDFTVETALKITRATLACTPLTTAQALPGDWIATMRVVWVRASDSRRFVLQRADTWELDAGDPDWRTATGEAPVHYCDAESQTLGMIVAPAPPAAGTLEVSYIALPTLFTGAGTPVEVIEDASPGILWGAVGRMLRKEGRAKDPTRARFAEQHRTFYVEAVKTLLGGLQ